MLNDEEEAAFHTSITNVRRLARDKLSHCNNAIRAIAFVNNLHRSVDSAASQATAIGPRPECTIGCAHCCHVRVEATDPEVLLIANAIRQQAAPMVDTLTARLTNYVAMRKAAGAGARIACSFLIENQCSIYAIRPATCRKAHSLSVAQCENHSPEIPQNLKLLLDAEALMTGTAEAYRDLGLPASVHDMNAAVLDALNDEGAEARWFQSGMPALPAQDI